MSDTDSKFGSQVGESWLPHDYGRVYAAQETTGQPRLCASASDGGSQLLLKLSAAIADPFYLLYVLVVPRGGGIAGRYQSRELTRDEIGALVERYGEFWDSDGRHSVWIHSPSDSATLVYDRHNVIYCYGPLDAFAATLDGLGFRREPAIAIPYPHQHHYWASFDETERDLLAHLDWRRTDLREDDET